MDTLYKTFVVDRIVFNPDFNSLTKISVINDEFKDWYMAIHGNTKGCKQVIKDLKPYLEKRFGKCPTKGWNQIKMSEAAYAIPDLTEEMKVIQKINTHMGDVNKLIHDLIQLKTIEFGLKIKVMEAELKMLRKEDCIKCKNSYETCVCFDGN